MKKIIYIVYIFCMLLMLNSKLYATSNIDPIAQIEDIKVPDINMGTDDKKNSNIYGEENTNEANELNKELIESQKEAFKIDDYISKLDDYSPDEELFNLDNLTGDLIAGKGIQYDNILKQVLGFLGKEILVSAKGFIAIFIAIVLMGIVKNIQTESEESSVYKIVYFATYILISTMVISTFISSLELFKTTTTNLLGIVQVATPFLMTLLIATGSITTTGIISPMILFIVQFIGFLINAVVIPLIILSLVFNVISNISDRVKLSKISKLFSKSALWIIGTTLTLFLCVISLEGGLTSSVDGITMKTVQAGVANVVPVVGKFFSDSLDAVVGAGQIIKNVTGIVSIIAIIGISIFPVLKLLVIMLMFKILAVISEPIADSKIANMLRRILRYVQNTTRCPYSSYCSFCYIYRHYNKTIITNVYV